MINFDIEWQGKLFLYASVVYKYPFVTGKNGNDTEVRSQISISKGGVNSVLGQSPDLLGSTNEEISIKRG